MVVVIGRPLFDDLSDYLKQQLTIRANTMNMGERMNRYALHIGDSEKVCVACAKLKIFAAFPFSISHR